MEYRLKVEKNLALIDYEYRRAVYRELVALIARHGVTHADVKDATRAAEEISRHPLVVSVTMVVAHHRGTWQQGERR